MKKLGHLQRCLMGVALGGLLGLGCASKDDSEQVCEVVGVGEGPCCDITRDDGETTPGACIENMCTNGRISQANGACATRGSIDDQGVGVLVDQGPGLGGQGGQGGIGGQGGQGGAGGQAAAGGAGGAGAAGGEGGEGGAGAAGGQGGQGGVGGEGGQVDPCAGVVCEPDERCNRENGLCESDRVSAPAGACAGDGECADGADCITEEASMGSVPGGFCRKVCEVDGDCGPTGACLPSGQDNICFDQCGGGGACREGWACVPVENEDISVCLPDCRVAACGDGFVCNEESGACEPEPTPCEYPCQMGEECQNGRCVRLNGTCDTDYHCPLAINAGEVARQCRNGQCVVQEFADCVNPDDCDATQTCIPRSMNPLDGGFCLFSCAADAECPVNKACYPQERVCFWLFCGPAANDQGEIYGACPFGVNAQMDGTCVPLATGDEGRGVCFEAGNVPTGGACDEQNVGRAPADRALQCAPGNLCFGDPDDPLDPNMEWGGRGNCRKLCDPRENACPEGLGCLDFGSRDDPATADANEDSWLGLCLPSDCDVLGNECAAPGQICRPYNFLDNEGLCSAPGAAALGAACEVNEDCADHAFCANAGNGPICLAICDPNSPAPCGVGQQCISEDIWSFGVCL